MRNKIDYGIDLGTTNSAIARMDNGKPKVIQSDLQKDTMPSCVAVNPRKNILVGDSAVAVSIKDKLRELETFGKQESNSFSEFKRTMGKDVLYHCSSLDKDFSSEELSAEVLKKLKSFITDEQVKSIVITVPAKFTIAQNEATMRAAKLAGFEIVELLQEPIAASIAYGLDAKNKEGIWLVFDFGGGTFDAALVRVEEGIMKVLDTEGDNQLGGKDLDFSIVDKLIIPHLQEIFSIEGFLKDTNKKEVFRNALKSFAERVKIDLSFNPSTDITTLPGEIRTVDDKGNELEISLDISQEDLLSIFEPIFQKAIDITKTLLHKRGLKGSDLECLILVGGPTYSPILQRMLKEQITSKIIAKNQMTSVATGAALYASTKDIGVPPPPPPTGTIVLEIKYEATTVELDTMVNLKINSTSSSFAIPEKVFAVLERGDKSYSSNKVHISDKKASLIEILLNQNEPNYFSIILTDEKGDILKCQPNNFTILQGIKEPLAPLPYHIGIEVWNEKRKIKVFKGLRGLEKNQILKGAVGVSDTLKTPKQITAGKITDILRIPIYQGEDDAEGKNSFHSNHVTDVIITGETIPRVLPANSDLVITLTFDESGGLPVCSVFFPSINHTEETQVEIALQPKVDAVWLSEEIKKDINRTEKFLEEGENDSLQKSLNDLEELENEYSNEQGSEEGKIKILNNLRKIRLNIDKHESDKEKPSVMQELKDSFYRADDLIDKIKEEGLSGQLNMPRVEARLEDFRSKVDEIIRQEDVSLAKETTEEIDDFVRSVIGAILPEGTREREYIEYVNNNIGTIIWIQPRQATTTRARELINRAIANINSSGDLNHLKTICQQISDLIDRSEEQPDIPKI